MSADITQNSCSEQKTGREALRAGPPRISTNSRSVRRSPPSPRVWSAPS